MQMTKNWFYILLGFWLILFVSGILFDDFSMTPFAGLGMTFYIHFNEQIKQLPTEAQSEITRKVNEQILYLMFGLLGIAWVISLFIDTITVHTRPIIMGLVGLLLLAKGLFLRINQRKYFRESKTYPNVVKLNR